MAQFLTFHLGSDYPHGVVTIHGQFDESWGFSFWQGPSGKSRFGNISMTNNALTIVWNGGTNHRFNLRFSDAAETGYTISGDQNLAHKIAESAQVVNAEV